MIRVFRQYIPETFLVLGVVEFVLGIVAVHLGANLWLMVWEQGLGTGTELDSLFSKSLAFSFISLLSLVAMGLYQRHYRYAMAGMILRIILALLGTALTLVILYFWVPILSLGRGIFGISFAILAVLILTTRALFIRYLDQNLLKRRILVLGAGETAAQISRNLRRRTDQQGFIIIGYVHVRGEHDVVKETQVIRPEVPLLALAKELEADEIVVAVGEKRRRSFPVHDLLDCKLSGIDVIDLQVFFERETGRLKLDILNPSWLIYSEGFRQYRYEWMKRIIDIIGCLTIFVITFPIMVIIAILVFLESGSPIFYPQIRVGQHWKLFNVYKFRSMKVDAEKVGGVQWATENDKRVTRIGRIIRKIRLDELPQIYNVLKGDMSIVGPRPERPEFVTTLTQQIPYFAERSRIKPGITGWAQVHYPYGSSERDSLAKLEYDLYYVKNISLLLDIIIFIKTVEVMIWGKGAR